MTPHTVRSGGAQLHAVSAGSGDPVLFLHAGVADHRMWLPGFGGLADRATILSYDRRGFGRTTTPDEVFSHVDDALAVLDALATGPAVLIGASQGGRIAVDLALAHPDRVSGLILVAPAISGWPGPDALPPPAAALEEAIDAADAAGDLDALNALEAHAWLDGPASPAGRVTGEIRDRFLAMNGLALAAPDLHHEVTPPSALDRLGDLRGPTTVIYGSLDYVHVQARSVALATRIGAVLHRMDGVAHLPALEAPDLFATLVRGVLGLER